jgi:DNA-directed RNA polymerase subunit RPC12/RpoP
MRKEKKKDTNSAITLKNRVGQRKFLAYNKLMNLKEEEKNKGFICVNCGKWVTVNPHNKTLNRNHCPYCLWSKHVDKSIAGDRMESCNSGMKPIGLTIKTPRVDKWGIEVKGELMLIHECVRCGKITINRLLAEDDKGEIMNVFELGKLMDEKKKNDLMNSDIFVLQEKDRAEVEHQIFGN